MTEEKAKTNVEWEAFYDHSFFGFFAVRPVGDTDFNSSRLFHFLVKEDAEQFKKLVEKAHISLPRN